MTQSGVRENETRQGVRQEPGPGGTTSATGGTPGGPSGEGRPRRTRRLLRWSAAVLALLILGTAGAGYLYYRHLNGNIKKDALNLGDNKVAAPTPNAAGQTPLNILLIGSDARDSKENQKLGGARETFGAAPLADVQMLLHLSADRTNMSVISMPRDTLVKIPKCTDPDDGKVYPGTQGRTMTNQSLGNGGPGCTVATWQELTGIHIDHFIMVDFAGVVSMADAVGGVPVCVDANIHSRTSDGKGSGLKLEKGTSYIQGEQALQWLRTRYGFEDGSDLARAKAQHMYMNAMVRQLRENATLSSPNKLRRLAEEATRALTVDPGLDTVKKLYDLSDELRKVEPERITMTTMPNRYVGARVEPTEDAEQLFRLVREDIALDGKDKDGKKAAEKASADPAAADGEIPVQVRNGTRTDTRAAARGRASTVAGLLTGQGFTQAVADTTGSWSEERTVVRYPSADLEGDAQRIAKALGIPLGSVKRSTDVSGVTLVVGADWREGTAYKAPKRNNKTPKSAQALNGADDKACMHVNPNFTW
ncbi:LCP family protein [Streptomyces coeruleorubidus]|uniref:LytR family transcriptional regulator n=1 Tax=Streptomyces coeruleorubidus TaxID=116188 RepID=A0A5J6I060_STRC4|nr:LCP family protein [Streptomyces coeruleorubidus]QEV25809.1 LytR family transcriptional regulator [Streptomyces coeruleorubidus]GGT93785.1 transcriptional regulator [Streptomyces coeruleorubidus]